MESALVGSILVDVFDDVDLSGKSESIHRFKGDEGIVVTSPPFGQFGLLGEDLD